MTMCFDATNLKALNFYLPQMGLSVEDKLKKYLDQRFEERIPENIRQFIQYQTGTAQNDQRVTDQNQSINPEPSSRRSHRERSREIKESASEQTMA